MAREGNISLNGNGHHPSTTHGAGALTVILVGGLTLEISTDASAFKTNLERARAERRMLQISDGTSDGAYILNPDHVIYVKTPDAAPTTPTSAGASSRGGATPLPR